MCAAKACPGDGQQGPAARPGSAHVFNLLYYFMHLSVCPHVYLCTLCVWGLQRPGKGTRRPGTGVTDRSELPRECRELNLDHLEERPVLLTTEPSLSAFCSDSTLHPEAQQHSQVLEESVATVTEQPTCGQDFQSVGYVVWQEGNQLQGLKGILQPPVPITHMLPQGPCGRSVPHDHKVSLTDP